MSYSLSQSMKILTDLKENAPELDAIAKEECNGWYKVDFNKYARMVFNDEGGNCFYANWNYYQDLRKTNKKVKLYVVKIKKSGFTHAFILDGDIMYDRSQYRDIKIPFYVWTRCNEVVGYNICNTKSPSRWLKLCDRVENNKFDYKGEIKV